MNFQTVRYSFPFGLCFFFRLFCQMAGLLSDWFNFCQFLLVDLLTSDRRCYANRVWCSTYSSEFTWAAIVLIYTYEISYFTKWILIKNQDILLGLVTD
ncbi:hypothetical protein RCL_jg7092.t2 [Rhizophagus clarus]|uniref:Uncharacterized protein n=1 Tax=Rhizophagus clarus TaxID=94130 RepID=A0A8H3M634_9GLOM|nr:hypothetical protein RCL_jg7092.t2 [Rhizophagus clarus]